MKFNTLFNTALSLVVSLASIQSASAKDLPTCAWNVPEPCLMPTYKILGENLEVVRHEFEYRLIEIKNDEKDEKLPYEMFVYAPKDGNCQYNLIKPKNKKYVTTLVFTIQDETNECISEFNFLKQYIPDSFFSQIPGSSDFQKLHNLKANLTHNKRRLKFTKANVNGQIVVDDNDLIFFFQLK